jgi:hypothetical protein
MHRFSVARHIETRNRAQIYDLIELWVEIRIGLGLVLAVFDFLPRHTLRPGADYQAVFLVNNATEWHTILTPVSDLAAPS